MKDLIEEVEPIISDFKFRPKSSEAEKLAKRLSDLKSKFVNQDNQKAAKIIWFAEKSLEVRRNYSVAFSDLREGNYYEGWCKLARCEIALDFIDRHFSVEETPVLGVIAENVKKLQSIFPYRIFFSPELIIEKQSCTICGEEVCIRSSCDHEVGEIYDGEMCGRRIEECKFLSISVVESPLQKYSVPFLKDPDTGERVDQYDYSAIEYLFERISSRYDYWDVEIREEEVPHSEFQDVNGNEKCPCGSGDKYKNCCLKKSGVLKRHYEFIL